MYGDDNSHSFVGVIVNAIVVCLLWLVLRQVVRKYHKEC
jgi:hypothetical protein